MRMLTKEQLNKMNEWMQVNARPYDRAKWNYLFNGGSKEQIVEEMLKIRMQMAEWAVVLRQMCFARYQLQFRLQKQFSKHMNMILIVLPNGLRP